MLNIRIEEGYLYKEEIKELFREYTNMLVENDEEFKNYLEIQNYDEELNDLELKYSKPWGRLYIVFCDDKPGGCIALKKIDKLNCEMKRLYVRKEYRGKKISEKLINKIIDDAVKIGYNHMLLDTLPFLKSAIHLYKKFGFYEIESYNNSPMDTSIYMKLDIDKNQFAE